MTTSFLNTNATELIAHFKNQNSDISGYYNKLFQYIETKNPDVNALTSIEKVAVQKRLEEIQKKLPESRGILYGLPIVIKENIQKVGYSVQCASKILQGYKGQFDSTLVSLLEKEDAVIIGTANMDEFAMGSSNEHSVHGPVKNPHDMKCVSGGSSGGSAVAATLGFAPITFGSDTGGSVREPAAFCGIYGFKPSYGRVSRYGLVAYGSSLDQISPFGRSVADLDLIMQVVGKPDEKDGTSLTQAYTSQLEKSELKGKKVGVLRHLLTDGVDDSVKNAFLKMEQELKNKGCDIVDVELSTLQSALSVYYILACSEASSNLSRFDGIRFGHRTKADCKNLAELYAHSRSEGFGDQVKLRIMLGSFALSTGYYDAYYGKALDLRQRMMQECENIFQNVDFLYLPTAPSSAFPLGKVDHDPTQEYLFDVFTVFANLAGIPAISVPAPTATGEMPIGLQFMAQKGCDAQLLAFAHTLEKEKLTQVTPLNS